MKRIKNYYCWYTLEDWLDAQNQGFVEMRKPQPDHNSRNSDHSIRNLLEMAKNDCVPVAIVCTRDKQGYHIEYSDPLYELFGFLRNERFLLEDGRKSFFADWKPEKKANILNAQIYSVWIDMA